jgi:hypothetical protein
MTTENYIRCGRCQKMDKEKLKLKVAGFCKFKRQIRSYSRNAVNCRAFFDESIKMDSPVPASLSINQKFGRSIDASSVHQIHGMREEKS